MGDRLERLRSDTIRLTQIESTLGYMRQRGSTLWCTGLSGAGKTTIALGVMEKLKAQNYKVELLDGDVVRTHLYKSGFS